MRKARMSVVVAALGLATWLGRGPWCSGAGQPEETQPHQAQAAALDDPHGEHATALAVLPAGDATHRARSSGDWSDPDTWDNGVPVAGARVLIPEGVTVILGRKLGPAIDWLRLEGTLRFVTDTDTELRVATIVIPASGSLLIGDEQDRVRADKTARILFTPRTAEHRRNDPFDLTGGIVALGRVQLHGSDYRGFAVPTAPALKGTQRLTFAEAPRGWKVGDVLLFPAATAGSRDEQRTITAVADDGKTVTLSAPLAGDHAAPDGTTARVPVGNLTRNIVLASLDPDTTANRAHLMFLSHEGVHLSGTSFRGLGRTVTTRIHSLPEKDAQGTVRTGDNLIGRYAVHFHLRGGASLERPPQTFDGNVIVDSPKHGLVNHGGHVVARNNVTFAVHGSHFFAASGSEVGAFRDNLAVWSRGSGDKIRARECLYDFGHGGHGFWAQSPAVLMQGNYAFHHADAAYAIFARPVLEFGRPISFDRKNLSPEVRASAPSDLVSPGSVPFHFAGNVAGNSGKGLELWNTNTDATHNVPGVVADCQFWHTPGGGIALPDASNTQIRHTTVLGRPGQRYPTAGISGNAATKYLVADHVTVAGFATGIEVPVRGHNTVTECRFDNAANVRITSPVQPGRRTVLTGNRFVQGTAGDVDYFLAEPDCKFNGDLSLLFDRDLLLVEDARFPGQTLYFAEQHPDAVPFPRGEVEPLRGKTAAQLWAEYGLAIAGAPAPASAQARPGVRGLVGPVSEEIRRGIEETAGATFADEVAALAKLDGDDRLDRNRDRVRFVKGKPGEPSGWRLETRREGGRPETKLFYVDSTATHFELSPCMKLEIHPDDVKYGLEICGVLHDEIAGKKTIKHLIKEYKDVKVDEDGYVTVNFSCSDAVGNTAEHTYRFKVTEAAVKRGPNTGHYNQKEFISSELQEPVPPTPGSTPAPPPAVGDAPCPYRWWVAGGGGAAVALGVLGALVWWRRKRSGIV
jgi:hypothetical protein